ncbi:MAG: hypothetical protein ACP5IB_08370, partial [Thermoplasmata archaeon]
DNKINNNKPGYYDFRIWDGREIKPINKDIELKGDIIGREKTIRLTHNYKVQWNVYSDVSKNENCKKNGIFKYALIEVRNKGF